MKKYSFSNMALINWTNYKQVCREKYSGGVDKLEKKGSIRGWKAEIAISSICKIQHIYP